VGHHFGDIDLDDPNFERRPYDSFIAYGGSKTANALFALEFDRRHKSRGVRAASVHPGGILTELARYMTPEAIKQMTALVMAESGGRVEDKKFKSVEQGAATTVWAAVRAPAELIGGHYCEDCHVADVAESGPGNVRPYAADPERAKAVWALSEKLVGESFPA
jgi:NAD(P)-dependent dehydrogenase (short-subunit alcohol dehydrogenase family)